MASIRDVRRKIRVVKNISQITQAMKMVAAARLRRVQERVEQGRPYAETMTRLVGLLAPAVEELVHPLLDQRPVTRLGVVVVAADKGLAGSYNSNLLRLAQSHIKEQQQALAAEGHEEPVRLVTIGRKATDFFKRRGYMVEASFPSLGPSSPYDLVRQASEALTGMFLTGRVDAVHIVYTEFVNTIVQRPQVSQFLPIEPPRQQEGLEQPESGFIFEPPAPVLLGVLLPRYVETRFYQLLLESVASEYGARMTAMTNATKNAGEQIERLSLLANRTRQAGITKELLDIVSGAEALRG